MINKLSTHENAAKQAKISGKTIGSYQRYPQFLNYLKRKKAQSDDCSIRVYEGNIYIWKEKLVAVFPIPEKFKNLFTA